MRLRRLIFQIHLWVGLAVGLLLTLAGLSGSVLVFRREVDTVLNPGLLRVSPGAERVSLQRVAEAVHAAHPERSLSYLRVPRTPFETYEATTGGADPLQVYVDPYRGVVLGERGATEGLVNTLFDLHVHLLAGESGERVMGAAALLSLLLVATGVVVWWPRARRWWVGFVVQRRANWKRVNFDLHRAGGIWSAAFLLVTAFTGAALVFYQPFEAALDRVTASPPAPPRPTVSPRTGASPLPLDSLVHLADRALPGGVVTYVSLPATPTSPLSVRKHLDPELHPNGRSFVYLDPWSGEVLAAENALLAPAGTRLDNLVYPLHIGRFGGVTVRVLYALLGLFPLLLFVSGCLMWWNRAGAPKRRR